MNRKLFEKFKQLGFPLGKYEIISSGPLGIRNIREIADIDVIVTDDLWEELSEKYEVSVEDGLKKIHIDDDIEVISTEKFENDVEEQIRQAEIIEEMAFQPLDELAYYKERQGREKDLKDVELIKEWQSKNLK